MMSIGLHCRLVGRPGRLASLERFIKYVKNKKVWIVRRIDIARHWLKHHPHGLRRDPSIPPTRLLMGPGPINADPRVLRVMGAPLLGQFDPVFRAVHEGSVRALPRRVPDREPLDAAGRRHRARAIEAALVSLIEPGDRVLVPVFGRFGHLKVEIAKRCGAEVRARGNRMGHGVPAGALEASDQASSGRSWSPCRTAIPRPRWRSRWPSSASSAGSTTRSSMSTRPPRSAAWTCRPTPGSSTW